MCNLRVLEHNIKSHKFKLRNLGWTFASKNINSYIWDSKPQGYEQVITLFSQILEMLELFELRAVPVNKEHQFYFAERLRNC